VSDEEIVMLDYDERMARPEKRRLRGANHDRADAHARRAKMAVIAPNGRAIIAPNGRLSIVDEQADDLACELLMERLDAWVDGRFVPEIV
jgi:hypothetical protein